MVQYLEAVFRCDLTQGWKHAMEKVKGLFNTLSEVDSEEKGGERDWTEKLGDKWWY